MSCSRVSQRHHCALNKTTEELEVASASFFFFFEAHLQVVLVRTLWGGAGEILLSSAGGMWAPGALGEEGMLLCFLTGKFHLLKC